MSIRHVGECFQRSNETISWYVHLTEHKSFLTITMSLVQYVCMPTSDAIQPEIGKNSRFWPFFKDVISALFLVVIFTSYLHCLSSKWSLTYFHLIFHLICYLLLLFPAF
ncbi:hypothetical protein PISMIDRAFT_124272 [Pisolithus microcarpus 441]|uniref:Uncharacterized protein n=1 Tax=Pisolithus microcarpus 441 TaxID=765257 RepID=A0A0C9YRA8_9AGAM|nr:hypothetical protein PISMIDRAFT_124272 [Pisolithus microcarpus 441]